MGTSDISRWKSAFDDLVLELDETTAPADETGEWFDALSRFSRHSFARLLLCAGEEDLRLRLELALGPPDGPQEALAKAVTSRFKEISETDWTSDIEDTPWVLETSLNAGDDQSVDRLHRILVCLLEISDHFDEISSSRAWFGILEHGEGAGKAAKAGPDHSNGSPFESIGEGSSATKTADGASIESTASTQLNDKIRIAVGFSQVLASAQIEALEEGLEHHLHARFGVQVRPAESDDRAELRLPSSARTALYFDVRPGEFSEEMGDLGKEVEGFLTRLQKFSSFGVDLFEYLGVGETVFGGGSADSDVASESKLSFRERASSQSRPRRSSGDDSEGVVLDLGGGTSSSRSLEPKNFTDPRLQRDDAKSALVDLVLRHPGYSDRRIGQVLSILLSIEYHDAIDIADSAPCVIAWGLGQQRARSFKEVIESAGGKILLVEPGTFGEG